MPLITENGWPQVPASALDKGFIPGSNVVRLETLAGDVTTILKGFAAWLDRNVEDMEYNYNNGERDDWAWSSTNSVWNSNHLSGTAFDYNATQWPMGYYRMPTWMVDRKPEGSLASASAVSAPGLPSSASFCRRDFREETMAISDIARTPLSRISNSNKNTSIRAIVPLYEEESRSSRR